MDIRESEQTPNVNLRRQKRRAEYVRNIRKQTERSRRNMRYGMFLVVLFIVAFSARIVQMLYGITVTDHKMYTEMAANTHTSQYPVFSTRGNILDSDGKQLAISTYTYTIGITPKVFGPRKTSDLTQAEAEEEFCRILDVDLYSFRQSLIENEERAYIVVKRVISGEVNEKLKTFLSEGKISGVRSDSNQARYYPQGDLASQIIGFANKREDNLSGVTGVESYYNEELSGKAGYVYRQVDNYWSQPLPNTSQADVPATPGYDLKLTIQSDLQRMVQDLTEQMTSATGALNGGQTIVMDPRTGSILAMSGENNFDLNNPAAAPPGYDPAEWNPNTNKEHMEYMTGQIWSNRATRYPYEIGSVMKPFVLAAGLDENVLDVNTAVDDSYVYVTGWPYPISSYDNRSRGLLSPAEAIWDSRNPPFVRIALQMGVPTFYDYVKALGLRDKTGVDLPNETVGLIHKNPQEIDMAVTAFGEQVTITAMQIANDYAMLANGGTLMKPRVVEALLDSAGNVVKEFAPETIRRVFSEESTREVREIMIGVGRYGTAKKAYIPGIEGGYKTGTSSRALGGSTSDNSFSHTAVILLPAEDPKYLIFSTMHDLDQLYAKGAQVTAREIGTYLIERDNLPLTYKAYDNNFIFRNFYPDKYVGLNREIAQQKIYGAGFLPVLAEGLAEGDLVKSQYPPAGLNTSYSARIWLSGENDALPNEYVLLPDFTGLTVLEAQREARRLGLNIAFNGSNRAGVCTSQSVLKPELAGGKDPGEQVRMYTQLILNYDGTDSPGPKVDDSLTRGYDNGTGGVHR